MKQSNTSRYAYLAGLTDADGCIMIKKHNRTNKNPKYALRIKVEQKDGRIADFLYGAFGGNVLKCKNPGLLKEGYIYRWTIYSSKAKYILKRLIPFLRYKKRQAEIAIRFQTHIENRYKKFYNKTLTIRELEYREKLYQQIKKEKQIRIPSAVVETKQDDSSN